MKFWLLLISALIIPFITSAKVLKAKAYLFKAMPSLPAPGMEIIGTIDFWIDGNNKVSINGTISGLAPGQHGFHVHQYGDMNNQCLAAGSHFNPHNQEHGSPNSSVRHVGDLGNIQAGSNGVASVNVEDSQVALNGENSVIGRATQTAKRPGMLVLDLLVVLSA
uniref:Superoxide dismutase copper/zinc binding domain-containing protein n=1 Tax=Acrobeloides nanus TaxID=290746 RepID=A0A914ELL5_9BILA